MRATMPVTHYDSVAMSLHWVIALLILLDFLLSQSFRWFNPGDALYFRSAYDLHMAVGLCVLLLSVARVGWRLTHRRPALPDMGLALRTLARASHLLLYLFMLAAPISGWLILALRRQQTSVFGLFRWAWPTLPDVGALPHAQRVAWHDALLPAHVRMSYVGICLVAVHILAAFYHHFGRRDEVLRRMLPQPRGESVDRAATSS